jgi:hypothetical protein
MMIYPWMLLEGNKRDSTTLSPELDDVQKDHPVSFFVQNQV